MSNLVQYLNHGRKKWGFGKLLWEFGEKLCFCAFSRSERHIQKSKIWLASQEENICWTLNPTFLLQWLDIVSTNLMLKIYLAVRISVTRTSQGGGETQNCQSKQKTITSIVVLVKSSLFTKFKYCNITIQFPVASLHKTYKWSKLTTEFCEQTTNSQFWK